MKLVRKLKWLIVAGALLVAGARLTTALQQMSGKNKRDVPTTVVKRGRLDVKVYITGEMLPAKSAMIAAPSVSGNMRIVRLARTGALVHPGDVVVEFDPSEQQYNLDQNRFDLEEAEQEIAKAKSDAEVQASKDQVELLKAKFDVRRAELDVSKNELVSAIDAKKNLLALEEAKRHLAQLEQDIQSHSVSNQAAVEVAREKQRKALLLMHQAEQNIQNMRMKSTLDGLVSVKENREASGGGFFTGMKLPEYREGDQVWPGTVVAEVMNVSQMEIQCKVDESDRSNLNAGQPVEVHVDSFPGRAFPAKVKTVAGMASKGMPWSGNTGSKFDVTIGMEKSNPDFRPGLTAQAVIEGGQTQDVLLIPPQAVFDKDGKPVVYVKRGSGFEMRPVKITQRTESQVAVEGVTEGTVVALVNPEEQQGTPGRPAPGQTSLVGGGGR